MLVSGFTYEAGIITPQAGQPAAAALTRPDPWLAQSRPTISTIYTCKVLDNALMFDIQNKVV